MKTLANKVLNEAARQKKRQRTIELICIWSVLIIPLINLAIFWVYGTIQSFPIAFEERHPITGEITGYGLFNFKYLIETLSTTGGKFLESLKNTLIYFFTGFCISTPLSFLIGYFLYKKIPGTKVFQFIFFLPSIVSSVIIVTFFMYLVGPEGLVYELFGSDILLLKNPDTALATLVVYSLIFGLNGNLLYWLSAYARIPADVVEAGKIDGTGFFTEFWYITLPCTLPFFLTILMLMFTGIFSAGGPALLMTGGENNTYDLSYYEYILTTGGAFGTLTSYQASGVSGALGLTKGLIILPIALLINWAVKKIETVEY